MHIKRNYLFNYLVTCQLLTLFVEHLQVNVFNILVINLGFISLIFLKVLFFYLLIILVKKY